MGRVCIKVSFLIFWLGGIGRSCFAINNGTSENTTHTILEDNLQSKDVIVGNGIEDQSPTGRHFQLLLSKTFNPLRGFHFSVNKWNNGYPVYPVHPEITEIQPLPFLDSGSELNVVNSDIGHKGDNTLTKKFKLNAVARAPYFAWQKLGKFGFNFFGLSPIYGTKIVETRPNPSYNIDERDMLPKSKL